MKHVYIVTVSDNNNYPTIDVFLKEEDALECYNFMIPENGRKYTINDGAGKSPGEVTVDTEKNITYTIQKKKITIYKEHNQGHDWGYQ